jgi:hypothetical protein
LVDFSAVAAGRIAFHREFLAGTPVGMAALKSKTTRATSSFSNHNIPPQRP